ncbi:unnamed protein product [Rhodiola kirilowii]
MPDTRSTAETLEHLSSMMSQLMQSQAEDRAENRRMSAALEQLTGSVHELQLTAARSGKQPLDETTDSRNVPLLATPERPPRPATPSGSISEQNRAGPFQVVQATENQVVGMNQGMRVEVPRFHGEGIDAWIFSVERYFEQNSIPTEQQVTCASYYLGGEALQWYQYLKSAQLIHSWQEFVAEMRERFGRDHYWRPGVALNKLTQRGTVAEYIAEFVSLVPSTTGMTPGTLLDRFLAGLKEEVHLELVLLEPNNLRTAMGMAKIAEQKLRAKPPPARVFTPRGFTPHSGGSTTPLSGSTRPQGSPSTGALPIKRLTPTEMAARREKGLCFNCDE